MRFNSVLFALIVTSLAGCVEVWENSQATTIVRGDEAVLWSADLVARREAATLRRLRLKIESDDDIATPGYDNVPSAQDHWMSCRLAQDDGTFVAGPVAIDASNYVEFNNVTFDLFVLEADKVKVICQSSTLAVESGTPDRYAGVLENKNDIEFEDTNGDVVQRINHVTGLGTYVDVLDNGDLEIAFDGPPASDMAAGDQGVLIAEYTAYGAYEHIAMDQLYFHLDGHIDIADSVEVIYTQLDGNMISQDVYHDANGDFNLSNVDALADADGELIQVYADISVNALPGQFLNVTLNADRTRAYGLTSGARPNLIPASGIRSNNRTVF